MTRARAALLLAAIFVAGTATGAMGTAAWLRHRPRGAWGPARVERVLLRRMTHRLDLDDAQRRTLRGIASDTRARVDGVRRDAMEQVREAFDEAYDRLEPSLRPEQRKILDEMRRDARSRFRGPAGDEKPR